MYPQIFILSGAINSGKSTYIENIIKQAQKCNYKINALLSSAYFENNEKVGYDLYLIPDGEKRLLARTYPFDKAKKFRRFYFSEQTINWANNYLISLKAVEAIEESEIVIIDEIGHLELNKEGFYPGLKSVYQNQEIKLLILVVRKHLIQEIKNMLRGF